MARHSGLYTRDLSTAMVNCGAWEEISMNVLSTPVAEGWWWWWLYFLTDLLICSFWVRFSHAMKNQTPQTWFYLGFIVWGRSRKWLKVTSFLGGRGASPPPPPPKVFCNEYALRYNLVHFETQFWEMLRSVHWPHRVWMIFLIQLHFFYTVMITTFLGGSWAFLGGSFYPSNTLDRTLPEVWWTEARFPLAHWT